MANSEQVSRRRFLRQSVSFSAFAGLSCAVPGLAERLAKAKASSTPATGARHALIVGDWGRDNSQLGQRAVAAAMQRYQAERGLKTEALLMLGDSWYGELEGGIKSPRWQWQFEEMYPKSAFNCPAYSVLGNHDYQMWPGSKVEAELAYAQVPGTRWTMPARWYRYEFPRVNPLMTVIALDSNMPHPAKVGGKSAGRDFTLTEAERMEQLAWFEAELKKPRTTPFLTVIAHHPVYSDGPHGDHKVLIEDWDPLLREHKVQLYLAGHDHDLQHLEFEKHPTSFFLSGAGGADLYDLTIQPAVRGPYAEKVFGFSHLELTAERVVLRHVNAEGVVVHAFAKTANGDVALLA